MKTGSDLQATGRERRLLILTARLSLDRRTVAELQELLRQKIDWDTVISQSATHGTTGIIYKHLLDISAENIVPAEVMEKMRVIYLKITATGMLFLAQFKQVSERLAEEGIEIIVLKGASLIAGLYGDYGFRPMSDIDVLVHEKDWPRINRTLKELGYRSAEKDLERIPPKLARYDVEAHMQYYSRNGTCLEFQFDLLTIGIGMKDIAGVWARSREKELDGVKVRMLSPEDQLLHLTVHANRHGCMRLKWLVDITETIRQGDEIDWDLFVEIVRKENVQAIVYCTIDFVSGVFDSQLVPERIMNNLKPKKYKSAIWKAVWPKESLEAFNGRNEDAVTFYFYRIFSGWNLLNLVLMGRVKDKIEYQMKWLIPPMDWMSETYGKPKSLGLLKYYPLRVVDYKKKKKREI